MRVLMTTQGVPSHFFPMVPMAKAVLECGHDLAFAAPPNLCPLVEGFGFEALPMGPDWDSDPEIVGLLSEHTTRAGPEHAAFAVQKLFIGCASRRSLDDLEKAIASWRPDVIINETTEVAGSLLAEKHDIAQSTIGFGMQVPRPFLVMAVGTALDELRAEVGLPADPDFELASSRMGLIFAPSSYQPQDAPLGPTTHVLRPHAYDTTGDETLPDWLGELPDRPTVYATLGTVFADTPGVFEAIVDGLADEDLNVVATVSRDVDPTPLRGRAPNLHVEQYIPNSLLLPHCDAVVAHAGFGTVMGTLGAGLPMVLLPLGADQFLHAGRCSDLGCALSIAREEIRAESIRDAVRRLLGDPTFRKSAEGLAEEIRAMPDARHGVALLEQLVETGTPPLRKD